MDYGWQKNSSLAPTFLGQVLFCIFLSVISLLNDTALANHFQWGDKNRMSHPKETHLQKLWVWWKVLGERCGLSVHARTKFSFLKMVWEGKMPKWIIPGEGSRLTTLGPTPVGTGIAPFLSEGPEATSTLDTPTSPGCYQFSSMTTSSSHQTGKLSQHHNSWAQGSIHQLS